MTDEGHGHDTVKHEEVVRKRFEGVSTGDIVVLAAAAGVFVAGLIAYFVV